MSYELKLFVRENGGVEKCMRNENNQRGKTDRMRESYTTGKKREGGNRAHTSPQMLDC